MIKKLIGILILVGMFVGMVPLINVYAVIPEYDRWYKVSDFHFSDIEFDPQDPQIIYAGISGTNKENRGIYVSYNGGDTWSLFALEDYSILDIAIDPTNPNIMYAAAGDLGDDYGVLKSTDRGKTWRFINKGFRDCPGGTCRIQTLAINPSNPNEIFAGFWGIFKSTDGGETWNLTFGDNTYVKPIIIDPKNPQIMYAGSDRGGGVYKSTNGGSTWNEASNGIDRNALNIYALAIDPNNTQVLYASNAKGLYKTTDGTQSWTKLPVPGNEYNVGNIFGIAVDPKNSTVYISSNYGLAVQKSIDGGYTWVPLHNGLTWYDTYYIAINPHDTRVLFVDVTRAGNGMHKMIQSAGAPNYPATNLVAYPGNSKVALEWKAPANTSNVIGYYVYRGPYPGKYDEPATDFPIKETKYVDENVDNGKTYYYTVRAVHKDGTVSPASNEVSAIPKAPTPPVVNIPDNAKATSSQYTFTGKVEPGSTVIVNGKQVSVDASGNFTAVVTLTSGTNTITVQVTNKAGDTTTIKKTVIYGSTTPAKMTIVLKIGDPYMTVNGVKKEIDPGRGTVPVVVKGRTLLPIRALIETMGGTVAWEEKTQKVTIKLKTTTIVLTINSKQATVNGKVKELDIAPQLINGRTMVPLRFVTEALGASVDWNGDTNTVTIKY